MWLETNSRRGADTGAKICRYRGMKIGTAEDSSYFLFFCFVFYDRGFPRTPHFGAVPKETPSDVTWNVVTSWPSGRLRLFVNVKNDFLFVWG